MAKKRRKSKDLTVLVMRKLGTAVVVPNTARGRRFATRYMADFARMGSMRLVYVDPRNEYQTLRSMEALQALAMLAGIRVEMVE